MYSQHKITQNIHYYSKKEKRNHTGEIWKSAEQIPNSVSPSLMSKIYTLFLFVNLNISLSVGLIPLPISSF